MRNGYVQVRLHAPDLIERKHAEHFITSKRSFEYYQSKKDTRRKFKAPDKATRSAIDGRRTRPPNRRSRREGDLFLLRQLRRCVQCNRLVTTSSSRALPEPPMGPKPVKNVPPRYYRCRGKNSCTGSQVGADDIERRVLAWLRAPTGEVSAEARKVLTSYSPIWDVLFPESVRRAVAQLVWEVRWDGSRNEFAVMLDETAIRDAHVSILRQEEERAKKSTTRPRKSTRKRSR